MVGILYFSASPKYWQEVKSIKEENIQKGTGEDRWYLWKIAWKMFLDHPIIGVGPGNFPWNIEKYEKKLVHMEIECSGEQWLIPYILPSSQS